MKNFRAYQISKTLFRNIQSIDWPSAEFKDQAHRAALSIALNLAEGYGKRTACDRRRFFHIAMGSLREIQASLDLVESVECVSLADQLGGVIYRLIQNPGEFP